MDYWKKQYNKIVIDAMFLQTVMFLSVTCFALYAFFCFVIIKILKNRKIRLSAEKKTITIVISARNEEKNIPR